MKHQTRQEVPPGPIVPQGTLAAALSHIPDPRQPYGWHPDHPPLPLVSLLLLTLAAILAGANSQAAIAQWGRERRADHPDRLLQLGFPVGQSPSASTLHRLYRRLDAQAVEAAVSQWLTTLGVMAEPHLTVDGQTLRAVAAGEVPASHLVSVFAPQVRAVLAQQLVANKGHEQAAMAQLQPEVTWSGRTVSFDALHTHREVCQYFDDQGATFLAPVKGNQPSLEREIAALFDPWPLEHGAPPPWLQEEIQEADGRWAEWTDTPSKPHHGRWEWRRVCVWTDPRWAQVLGGTSEGGRLWPMVHQLVRVERRRCRLRRHRVVKEEQEVRYFLINHPLSARAAAQLIRGHWGIENLLHRQRDVLFDQDRCTTRSDAAPRVLATVRNLALTLFARAQVSNCAAQRRTWAGRPHLAVSFLLLL